MKLVALFASLLFIAPMALAQQDLAPQVSAANDQEVFDLEDGAMSQEGASALTPPQFILNRHGGNDAAAELIGVIGAIAADQIAFEGRRPGRGGPGHGGPGHGGPGWGGGPGHGGPGNGGPGWGGGGWNSDYVCYARDARGNLYRAIGPNPRRVQDRAMDKCEMRARFCRAQGCQRV